MFNIKLNQIIIKFNGGLGNQMFQYAFLKYMESKFDNVYGDLGSYKKKNSRPFLLEEIFDLKVNVTEIDQKKLDSYAKDNLIVRILRKFFYTISDYNIKKIIYLEKTL